MDYNNFNSYAKERVKHLRGETTKVEPWSNFAANLQTKKMIVARLQAFFKNEKTLTLPKARRSRN
jgi:hypothetical protein